MGIENVMPKHCFDVHVEQGLGAVVSGVSTASRRKMGGIGKITVRFD